MQDKKQEIKFFEDFSSKKDIYDVFTNKSNQKLIQALIKFGNIKNNSNIADIGCGTGTFTKLLHELGHNVIGIDICPHLIKIAKEKYPKIPFVVGDAEAIHLPSESLDAVLLSGIIHHLPDPTKCAQEVFRILKRGGIFIAFDPNRNNPFMWLYRYKCSPFYSSRGVTPNEQPVISKCIESIFKKAGFDVSFEFIAGLEYQYVESPIMKKLLPIYNFVDRLIFNLPFMRNYRPFLLTKGIKPIN